MKVKYAVTTYLLRNDSCPLYDDVRIKDLPSASRLGTGNSKDWTVCPCVRCGWQTHTAISLWMACTAVDPTQYGAVRAAVCSSAHSRRREAKAAWAARQCLPAKVFAGCSRAANSSQQAASRAAALSPYWQPSSPLLQISASAPAPPASTGICTREAWVLVGLGWGEGWKGMAWVERRVTWGRNRWVGNG